MGFGVLLSCQQVRDVMGGPSRRDSSWEAGVDLWPHALSSVAVGVLKPVGLGQLRMVFIEDQGKL